MCCLRGEVMELRKRGRCGRKEGGERVIGVANGVKLGSVSGGDEGFIANNEACFF